MLNSEAQDLFVKRTDSARRCVISTHVNPDGDAVGSQLALAAYLRGRGLDVRMINSDPTPASLRFLENDGPATEAYDPALHDPVFEAADLIILVDNSAPDRLGRLEQPLLGVAHKTLCIDHHPTRGTPWADNIIDPGYCATALMIDGLLRELGWEADLASARALFAGIATDTGFFRFNSTSPEAHEAAARLLRRGVDSAACYRDVYERNPPAFARLMGRALSDLRILADGALAVVRLTREMLDACDARGVDASEITTVMLAIDGVRIAAMFRELDGEQVKVSLRSKGKVDVHRLAAEFGGGGHRNASGIVIPGELDEVLSRVLGRAEELLAARSPDAGR